MLALVILIAAAGWLIVAGVMMALQPERALHILSLTATSQRVNLTEQILRLLAGAAMVVRADMSKLPELFTLAGWFIVATSVLLMVVPLAWHNGYAVWWARRIPLAVVRMIGPLSVSAGIGLAYAAW